MSELRSGVRPDRLSLALSGVRLQALVLRGSGSSRVKRYQEGRVYLPARDAVRVLNGRVSSTSTLRTWHERGLITKRGRNEYDMGSILNHLDS